MPAGGRQAVTVRRHERRGDGLRAAFTLAAAVAGFCALLSAAGPARAATYKWVDEKGVVHYTDKMPPNAVDKASVELGPQGIPIRKTDPAPTPEQRRAKDLEQARQRELAKQQEEIARRDRALMSSYANEGEIDLARTRSLQTINNVVVSAQSYIEQLTKRRGELEGKKAGLAGKPGAATLDRELENIEGELARQAELLAQKKRDAAAVTAKYDSDKQRWRELVVARAAEAAKGAEAAKAADSGRAAPRK